MVEILLAKGANFEHRNVSDYTPLSLAASGGYVNIIKMLLRAGADINSRYIIYCEISETHYEGNHTHYLGMPQLLAGLFISLSLSLGRTGTKLGITPLMLAAMNGHTVTVKLLLDMGSDINAQVKMSIIPFTFNLALVACIVLLRINFFAFR